MQARAKLSENKVNGPEDAIVSEMIMRLPMEKIYTFSGSDGVSKFMEGGEAGVLEEAGCRADQRDQKLQSNSADIGDVKVVRIVYPFALGEKKKSPKSG